MATAPDVLHRALSHRSDSFGFKTYQEVKAPAAAAARASMGSVGNIYLGAGFAP